MKKKKNQWIFLNNLNIQIVNLDHSTLELILLQEVLIEKIYKNNFKLWDQINKKIVKILYIF